MFGGLNQGHLAGAIFMPTAFMYVCMYSDIMYLFIH